MTIRKVYRRIKLDAILILMPPRGGLSTLLSKATKFDDESFWTSLDLCCESQKQFDSKLSVKAKQNFVSSIRYACAVSDKKNYIDIVLKLLMRLPQEPGFLKIFSQKDNTIFQCLGTLATNLFEKAPDETVIIRQIDYITALYHIFEASPDFHNFCGIEVANPLINLVSSRTDPFELINKAIGLLFTITDVDGVIETVQRRAETLYKAVGRSPHPRLQLQLLELLWRTDSHCPGADFRGLESQQFLTAAHDAMIASNDGTVFNIALATVNFPNGEVSKGACWLDIGIDDILLCVGEVAVSVSFEDIYGLDSSDGALSITFSREIEDLGVAPMDAVVLHLETPLTEAETDAVFKRISRGLSETNSQVDGDAHGEIPMPATAPEEDEAPPEEDEGPLQTPTPRSISESPLSTSIFQMKCPEPDNQEDSISTPVSIQPKAGVQIPAAPAPAPLQTPTPSPKPHTSVAAISRVQMEPPQLIGQQQPRKMKSSIARFIPESAAPNPIEASFNDDLFVSESSEDATFQPDSSSSPSELQINSIQDSDLSSPPPPDVGVAFEADPPEEVPIMETAIQPPTNPHKGENVDEDYVPKQKKGRQPRKQKVQQFPDNPFGEHPRLIADCLGRGLDTLTETRMDIVSQLADALSTRIEAFKGDIDAATREREHSTMKQLEGAKQRFLTTIQSFKRKEADIHQTLIGYEEETKQMASRIGEIQKAMRSEIARHRSVLEAELQQLRKSVRPIDEDEEEDPYALSDDDFD